MALNCRASGGFAVLCAEGVATHNADPLHLMTVLEELNMGRTYIVPVPATAALAV